MSPLARLWSWLRRVCAETVVAPDPWEGPARCRGCRSPRACMCGYGDAVRVRRRRNDAGYELGGEAGA